MLAGSAAVRGIAAPPHRALAPFLKAAGTERPEYGLPLTGPEVRDPVGMTPSARHPDPPDRVTVSVPASAYRRRPASRRTSYRKHPYSTARTCTTATSGSAKASAKASSKLSEGATRRPPRMRPSAA